MAKQLLQEFMGYLDISPQILSEYKADPSKGFFIHGVLQKSDTKNENGRTYPHKILVREAEKFQRKIDSKMSGGELDHPDSPIVNLKNVSHAIRKLWWEGNTLMGLVEVLSSPAGEIVKRLIESGLKIGISSRGIGSTKRNDEGLDEVQEDFEIITWDLVSQGSTPGSEMYRLNEGKEYSKNECGIYTKINSLVTDILTTKF